METELESSSNSRFTLAPMTQYLQRARVCLAIPGFAALSMLLLPACALRGTWGKSKLQSGIDEVAATAPEAWTAPVAIKSGSADGWLSEYASAALTKLVREAQAANPDLRAAAARVEQARAQLGLAMAPLLPLLGADFGANRAQRPGDQRFPGLGQRANRFTTGIDVSWEPDFWGRLSDERRASRAQLIASDAEFYAARLSLAANTVKAVVTLTAAHLQTDLARRNVEARRLQQQLLEKQLDRGLDPERAALDVSLGRADLARAESEHSLQKQALDAARRALETLLGRYPAGREDGLATLPEPRGHVPAGLPASLLARRPDLIAAENRLYAALNQESAARKALLPGIRLTGDRGYSSQELSNLITTPGTVWTLAGQVTQPLFEGGRLRAGIKLAQARYDESLNQYAASALVAFQEVETALAAERYLVEQQEQLRRAAEEAERSEKLAQGQYERGLVDVLTLLDSRQRAFEAGRALIATRAQRLRNRADLHLALGGGF